MANIKVIIDSRERNPEVISGLEGLNVELEFRTMPVGDYIVSDRICIERKTYSDFAGSIINSRIFDQAERMKESFEKPMLLIEDDGEGFRLSKNAIIGAVMKMYTEYNMQVLFSGSPEESALIISKIAEREQEGKEREPRLVGIKKAYTDYEWQLLILSSMPGVGAKIAKDMLSQFGSIKLVANAGVDELMKVDNIGRKKAHRIYSLLNADAKQNNSYLY
jgi:Fanconi anemia group M protein